MKSTFLLLIVLAFGINIYAQNGISFQGIARDPQGNAIVDKAISVRFTIGSFTETQNLETDNFGVFSAVIGCVNSTGFNNLIFANMQSNLKVEVEGTVIYDDKFNTVPYAKAAENGVPAGCIMPFAGSVTTGNSLQEPIPGWLVCNGAILTSDVKFDKLKLILGNLWGTNLLPDLRGLFLRGVNNGRTGIYADPDTRDVGSFQTDTLGSHLHSGVTNIDGEHSHTGQETSRADNDDNDDPHNFIVHPGANYYKSSMSISSTGSSHQHSFITNKNGDSETRPNNAAIVYLIKY
jgi:microcystin-dependent protein